MTLSSRFAHGTSSDGIGTLYPEQLESCRHLAATFVEDIIRMASEEVANRLNPIKSKETNLLDNSNNNYAPTIQIDLIGDRTPSPEDPQIIMPWMKTNGAQNGKIRKTKIKYDTDRSKVISYTSSQDKMDEIQKFAKSYVDDVIEKATTIACKRDPTLQSFHSGTSQIYKSSETNSSWLSRIRHLLRSLMVSLCLCKSSTCKQNSTHSFADV